MDCGFWLGDFLTGLMGDLVGCVCMVVSTTLHINDKVR